MCKLFRSASLTLASVALLACGLVCHAEQADRSDRPASISLEGLLRFLDQFAKQKLPVAMAIKAIEIHGLSFRPTPADMSRLTAAGATRDLLKAIETARVPPVVEAPVVREGRLAVGCRPVDCEVFLDGKPAGSTVGGEFKPIGLPEGPLTVSATRRSHIAAPRQQEVSIRPDRLARVEFQFTVDPQALAEAGGQLYQRMVAASSGRKREGALVGAGTLQIHESNQNVGTWGLSLKLGTGENAEFEMARAKQRYRILKTGNRYEWRKRPRTGEAKQLEEAARLILDYEYTELMQRIAEKPDTVAAESLLENSGGESIVHVNGRTSYVIHLDADFRPRQITFEAGGLNSGVQVLFSDFRQEAFGFYPRQTQIVLSGAGRQGIETRLDKLEVVDEVPPKRRNPLSRGKGF